VSAYSDLAAEATVLGAVFLAGGGVLDRVGVEPGDFYSDSHGVVYAAMRALHARGVSVDVITTADELRRRDQLDRVGGTAALDLLSASVPALGSIEDYGRIVQQLARDRRVRSALARALEQPGGGDTASGAQRACRGGACPIR
jgi:replicative DNA helicase